MAFPQTTPELLSATWQDFEPLVKDLIDRPLTAATLKSWMADWTRLADAIFELYARLYSATTLNTADEEVRQRFGQFLDTIYPQSMQADQNLKEKLLASGLEPEGFNVPLRNLRADADLFCVENLPLLGEEQKLGSDYDEIAGAQTIQWEGEEMTLSQMKPIYQDSRRDVRERAWRASFSRALADREKINSLWQKFLSLRLKLAANAGRPDYRAFRWQQMHRFDYTPEDSRKFQDAIEQVVVPAAMRVYERRRQRLGLDTLRPWDLDVDTTGKPPLRPFKDVAELQAKTSTIFHKVDPQLGEYFDLMLREDLMDLGNRKHKGPGAYCIPFPVKRKPFIFANAVGLHDDVQTTIHESGHAFHVFESAALPYNQQLDVPMEFAEVASMGMELLASPYLPASQGGFYTPAEAARALSEHLEGWILFWPYMAVVDAFQHWVYENPEKAMQPTECDAAWARQWQRFMHGVDWSGLDEVMETGWQRKMHIHEQPFYYIEYGLAQLGAVLVWRNALKDQAGAVSSYRRALALGGTATLPELFRTAGARLAFDAGTLNEAVALMESKLTELEKIQ
jgi:oligoendopeptidase F